MTSHPGAAQAGVDALRDGGSAADAAIAAAAVLCVVDPGSAGIGGDAFALYWVPEEDRPRALAAAGVAPAAMTIDALEAAGFDTMPTEGPWTVTVPGSIAGWKALHQAFGALEWNHSLRPAIELARAGFEVTPKISEEWAESAPKLRRNEAARRTFLPNDQPPRAGQRVNNPELARSLSVLAEEGPNAFYQGRLAEDIGEAVEAAGGPLRAPDLANWAGPEWVEPVSRMYRGVRIFELPPPGQGLAALQALGIYEPFSVLAEEDAEHFGIEAMKLALADAGRYIADPATNLVPVDELLSDEYLAERRDQIDPMRARDASPGRLGDTVYVAAVDGDGSACSFIQSLYDGFGSGVVVPGTGIALQNRGSCFVLDPVHPNCPAPTKRPYHTIIPAMFGIGTDFGGCLGVVGGFMQPQGQFQIVRNIYDRGMEPQAAVSAPRWRIRAGKRVAFEPAFDRSLLDSLGHRGHEVSDLGRLEAGGAQIILHRDGELMGGSDPRKDGVALKA